MEEPNEGDRRYITAVYDDPTSPNRVLVGWKVRIRGLEWLQIPARYGFDAATEVVDR